MTMKAELSLRICKNKSNKSPPYEWSHLKNPVIMQKYSIELKNRFHALQEKNPTNNTSYKNFVVAHKEASEKHIPKKEKIKKKAPWENEEITEKRKIVKFLAKIKNKTPTRLNKKRHQIAQNELEKAYINLQEKYLQQQIDEIKTTHVNKQSSRAWKIVKDVSGKNKTNQAKLKADSQEERLKKPFQKFTRRSPKYNKRPYSKNLRCKSKNKAGTLYP